MKEIKNFYPESYVEYFSQNKKNIKNYGIKIEQDINKNIFSNFIDKNFKIIEYQNKKEIVKDIDIKNIKSEIILDLIKQKIYVAGEKINSKEIQSQKQIVEILDKLLEKNIIKNTELKNSSYSSNKNEMSGKIIYPFIKLIKKRLNKDLDLKIFGSISNFSIQLGKNNLDIAVIKEI